MLVLSRFRRSYGIFFASHSSVRPPESFVVRRWRASRFGRGGWFWPNGEVGVETSLAAASSGDRGALWWGPKSAGFYLGGKKGALWRGSAFCASACRFDVLRRLLRGNLRYTAKAGSSTHSFCARALRGRGLGGIRGDFRQCMDNSGARPSHCTCGRPRCVRIPLLFREFARTVERHKAERR